MIFSGGSSGAAMSAAMEFAKDLREDQVCVVICPDNIRNYMTKFVVDNWMEARNFKESTNLHCHSWWNRKVQELIDEVIAPQQTFLASTTCHEIIGKLKKQNADQIAITDDSGKLLGLATVSNVMNKILERSLKASDPIEKGLMKKFVRISSEASIGKLSRILEKESFVVATVEEKEENRMQNGSEKNGHGVNGALNGHSNGHNHGQSNGHSNGQSNEHSHHKIVVITQKDLMKFLPISNED
jgi:cystathionine beta-synthase